MIDLKAIRERCEAATKGLRSTTVYNVDGELRVGSKAPPCQVPAMAFTDEDAEFLAHAYSDIPALLDAVEKLSGALLRIEWAHGHYLHEATCHWCGFTDSYQHHKCPIDEALNAIGLDTQGKRDAARRGMSRQ